MQDNQLQSCANCNCIIGKLEKKLLWDEDVVCVECHQRLTRQSKLTHPENDQLLHAPAPSLAELARTEVRRVRQAKFYVRHANPEVQIIEKTAKKRKAMFVVGAFFAAIGVVLFVVSAQTHDPLPEYLGEILLLGGFVIAFIARVAAWWNHG